MHDDDDDFPIIVGQIPNGLAYVLREGMSAYIATVTTDEVDGDADWQIEIDWKPGEYTAERREEIDGRCMEMFNAYALTHTEGWATANPIDHT